MLYIEQYLKTLRASPATGLEHALRLGLVCVLGAATFVFATQNTKVENIQTIESKLHERAKQIGQVIVKEFKHNPSAVLVQPIDGQPGKWDLSITSLVNGNMNNVAAHMQKVHGQLDPSTTDYIELSKSGSSTTPGDVTISQRDWPAPEHAVVWHSSDSGFGHDKAIFKNGVLENGGSLADTEELLKDAKTLLQQAMVAPLVSEQRAG